MLLSLLAPSNPGVVALPPLKRDAQSSMQGARSSVDAYICRNEEHSRMVGFPKLRAKDGAMGIFGGIAVVEGMIWRCRACVDGSLEFTSNWPCYKSLAIIRKEAGYPVWCLLSMACSFFRARLMSAWAAT